MNKRIFYLDFLRSFAIIMVLALHSISNYITRPEIFGTTSWYIYLVLNALTRTGVPIFFMISGYLMLSSDNSRDFRNFYKKSLLRIFIPLLFWNVAYFSYKCIMGYIDFDITILLWNFMDSGMEYHLWYLYTILGIYLIVPFLKMFVDNCTMKQMVWLLFLMICTTIFSFINTVTPLYIYFFDPLFNGYIGCFFMGYILGNIKNDYKVVICFSIAGILCLAVSVIVHHIHSSSNGINLVFNYGYSFCHYVLAGAIFMVSRYVFRNKLYFKGIVTALSKFSFGIYIVHVMVIDLILRYFMIDASPIVSSVYIFGVDFAISLIISFTLSKIKYVKKIVS